MAVPGWGPRPAPPGGLRTSPVRGASWAGGLWPHRPVRLVFPRAFTAEMPIARTCAQAHSRLVGLRGSWPRGLARGRLLSWGWHCVHSASVCEALGVSPGPGKRACLPDTAASLLRLVPLGARSGAWGLAAVAPSAGLTFAACSAPARPGAAGVVTPFG